jgi:hypothetical protein
MDKRTRNYLRGVGSIINLMPTRVGDKIIKRQSASGRMMSHFGRVAESFDRACVQYEHETKAISRKK